jgi:hypothetical protein
VVTCSRWGILPRTAPSLEAAGPAVAARCGPCRCGRSRPATCWRLWLGRRWGRARRRAWRWGAGCPRRGRAALGIFPAVGALHDIRVLHPCSASSPRNRQQRRYWEQGCCLLCTNSVVRPWTAIEARCAHTWRWWTMMIPQNS